MARATKQASLVIFVVFFLSQMATAGFPPYLNLMVGGIEYRSVPLSLILSSQPSMLSAMFSPDKYEGAVKDKEGYYIIDGDGKLFGIILKFLRHKIISINESKLYGLYRESRYFSLDELTKSLAEMIWDTTPRDRRARLSLDIWQSIPEEKLGIVESSEYGKHYYSIFNKSRKTTVGLAYSDRKTLEHHISKRKGNIVCSSSKYCRLPYNILSDIEIGVVGGNYGDKYDDALDPQSLLDNIVGSFMCSFYRERHDDRIQYAIFNILDGSVNYKSFATLEQCVSALHQNYGD